MRQHHWGTAAVMVAIVVLGLGCASDTATPTAASTTENPPASQVALSHSADTLLVDRSLRLVAIVPPNYTEVGTSPAWSSSDTTVAVVTQGGLVFARRSGRATVRVTVGPSSATTSLTVRPNLRYLRFEADTMALGLTQAVELPYRAIDSDGNPMDLKQYNVDWSSSSPEIAPVSSSGGILGRLLGETTVRLSVDGQASYLRVQVKPPNVANVLISPATVSPIVGEQVQLTAVATDAGGTALANRPITWSSGSSAIATVSATGLLTAVSPGTVKITAVCGNKRASLSVTVREAGTPTPVDTTATSTQAEVGSVAIALSRSSIVIGATAQATAVVKDVNSNVLTDRTVSWTSSDASIASVSATGLVTGVKAGSAVITGSLDGKAANAVVIVSAPLLAPRTITLTVPSTFKVGDLVQAKAVVKDVNGTVIPDAPVTWASVPSSVVAVSVNGVALGASPGTASISATSSSLTQAATVTVVDTTTAPTAPTEPVPPTVPQPPSVSRVAVSLSASSMLVGSTTQAVATAYDLNGQVVSGVSVQWTSVNTATATISATGVITAVAAGTANITALVQGVVGSATLQVQAPPPTNQVVVLPGQSIQSAVNANPTGTAFLLKAGTHANQSVVPKSGDTFTCEAGAVLDGGNVTRHAFSAGTGPYAANVTIDGCLVQRYTAPAQAGAIQIGTDAGTGGVRWTVRRCEVRENAGIGIRIGPYARILNNNVHHNHQLGIGGIGDSVVVEGNEIAANNYLKEYSFGWEAGGTKFVLTRDLVVRGNYVHDNWGPGLWTDIDNIGTLYENNRVVNNADAGIFHEISYRAVIRNNTVTGNGFAAPTGWLWGAGIQIAASRDVEAYGNTLAGNANGIAAIQQSRGSGAYGEHLVQNVYVHDNTVDLSAQGMSGVVRDAYDDGLYTSWNNRFAANHYTLGARTYTFAWANAVRSVAEWKAYGQDVTGTFTP